MVSGTEQRVVLVTGAADGIGLALVDELRKDRRIMVYSPKKKEG